MRTNAGFSGLAMALNMILILGCSSGSSSKDKKQSGPSAPAWEMSMAMVS